MTQFPHQSRLPGITAARETVEAQVWFGRYDQQKFHAGVLDSTITDAGNTGDATTRLRPGLLLAQADSDENLYAWSPYSTTAGLNRIAGVLTRHVDMLDRGSAIDRYSDLVMYGGNLKTESIIVPGDDPGGFSANSYRNLVRQQLKERFVLDDDVFGNYASEKLVFVTGTTHTLTEKDNNTTLSFLGAANTTITLPDPIPGLEFRFANLDPDQTVTLDTSATGTFNSIKGGPAADTYTILADQHEVVTVRSVVTAPTPAFGYAVLTGDHD